jgi:2-iminobutanoate/2-iminopropanoate deaminase
VSGTPGLDENGNIPADFADEARQAWRNVAAILEKAGASISDIVSIRQYLTREEHFLF